MVIADSVHSPTLCNYLKSSTTVLTVVKINNFKQKLYTTRQFSILRNSFAILRNILNTLTPQLPSPNYNQEELNQYDSISLTC